MKLISSFRNAQRDQHHLRRRLLGDCPRGLDGSGVITLGGGGARGLAHLGVMEAIGESGVQTERIVGVSIGALMGGLCAVDRDIHRVQASAIRLLYSPIFSSKCNALIGSASSVSGQEDETSVSAWFTGWYDRMRRMLSAGARLRRLIGGPSLMENDVLREAIELLLPDIDLRDTDIPLSIVAADLKSGQRVVLETGSLRKAILASTAIPGFFPPIEWDGMLLCDIGVLDSMPLEIASSYNSDVHIGVDVGSGLQRVNECGTAIEILMRMEEIGEQMFRRRASRHADLVIRPDVSNRAWYDFRRPEELIDEGRRAGRKALAMVG